MAKRILVPLDRTSTSEAVLPFVSDLAHGAGSTVRLLRVEPVPNNVVSDSGRVVAYTDQEMARLEAEGLAHLDAIATLLQGVPVERVVRFGDPASEILTEADTFCADVIALTTLGRSWPRRRWSVVSRPRRRGSASRFAAATASWIARLMPTPPIGDIAWAASPMQSRPGRYHRRRRSTRTVSSFASSQSRISRSRLAANGASLTTSLRNVSSPRWRICSTEPFGIT